MKITPDVISDLWPLYAAGEATPDTRALVEEFLAGNPGVAERLRKQFDVPSGDTPIPPDAEARALQQTKDVIGGSGWLRGTRLVALVLTILAIARLGSDDSETVWGRVFVAGAAWLVYLVSLHRARRNALRAATPRPE
ncbi:MAG: hypothetical protein AB1806_10350 [Acidobacteriota bacterium]